MVHVILVVTGILGRGDNPSYSRIYLHSLKTNIAGWKIQNFDAIYQERWGFSWAFAVSFREGNHGELPNKKKVVQVEGVNVAFLGPPLPANKPPPAKIGVSDMGVEPNIVCFPPKSSIFIGLEPLFSPSILVVFPLFLETTILPTQTSSTFVKGNPLKITIDFSIKFDRPSQWPSKLLNPGGRLRQRHHFGG